MMSKNALPLLAIIGLAVAIGAVIRGNETPAIALPPVQAAKVPFASYVAGAGIIEASTENIAIGTPVAGIVTAIYVKWNDRVNAGDPLFKIDDRDMQGQLLLAIAKVKEAEANLAKVKLPTQVGRRFECRELDQRTRQGESSLRCGDKRGGPRIGDCAS